MSIILLLMIDQKSYIGKSYMKLEERRGQIKDESLLRNNFNRQKEISTKKYKVIKGMVNSRFVVQKIVECLPN
mgnify:CR=1 FL=1